jgi:hypothetical protein
MVDDYIRVYEKVLNSSGEKGKTFQSKAAY